ncbi:MAG: DMP19 family protein [Bacteroidaceae bacterium]|nr:DMP19 family protein [Bacteroidaceae bacterium]
MMQVQIKENEILQAAKQGMDAFVDVFYRHILSAIGGELNAQGMQQLNADQTTLLAYITFRDEVMDGGFIQLIHNGYGPFIFLNPFAKAMRLWGAKDFCNLVYKGRKLFEKYNDELTAECTDEEFMALFEQYPEFDELDDAFVEMEEDVTETVARYIDEHLENFAEIEKGV